MNKKIRSFLQLFFFLIVGLIGLNKTFSDHNMYIPFIPSVSLHAICPFGGVESIISYVLDGRLAAKLHESSVVLMLIVLTLTFLVGPIFCSSICPLGTLQEWIGRIGKKLFNRKYNNIVPHKIHQKLTYLRYIILIWVIVTTYTSMKLAFLDFDPYYALFNFWTGEVAITSIIILLLVIFSSLFVERPFCKYFCPYGGFLGLIGKFRLIRVSRNTDGCVDCKICDNSCPMNINISNKKYITSASCNSCFTCVENCPISNALCLQTFKNRKSFKSLKLLTFSILLFFIGISTAVISNHFKTEGSKIPALYEEGPYKGQYNPLDIRGSYKFGDIEKVFEIPSNLLAKAFLVNSDFPSEFEVKNIEEQFDNLPYEIGTASVRRFVALYKKLPYEGDDILPLSAVQILDNHNKITADQKQLLFENAVSVESINIESYDDNLNSEESHFFQVTGQTLVSDAIDMGIEVDDLKVILDVSELDKNKTIRDIAQNNGISFKDIKEQLNNLIQEKE